MKVTSIEKYVEAIMEMKRAKDSLHLNANQWFFRGQKNSTWATMPSVFRNDGLSAEYVTIQKAVGQNPFEFRSLTEFETLTKLQHYGLATRLLDVTLNPLVALYFATEPAIDYELGKDKRYKQVEKDGVVFYQFTPVHMLNELGVRIAMVIPFINFKATTTVSELLKYLSENRVISESEYNLLERDNFKLLIEYIQKNYYIVTSKTNERLSRQSGAFVLPTAIKINDDSSCIQSCTLAKASLTLNSEFDSETIVIPADYKQAIREELDFFNINEATLFPELEHQMTYIQRKNVASTGSVAVFSPYTSRVSEPSEYNEFQPDVKKIITSKISGLPNEVIDDIVTRIEMQVAILDWKLKPSVRSKIRAILNRKLQLRMSAFESGIYADRVLECLLNPEGDYIKQ